MLNNKIITLHRYFIWADSLYIDFSDYIKVKNNEENAYFEIEAFQKMSLWYAMLYVIIEGWEKLELYDRKISKLISSYNSDLMENNKDLLRKYRNFVFHFQENYWDKRFSNIFCNENYIKWVDEIHNELGKWLLSRIKGNI